MKIVLVDEQYTYDDWNDSGIQITTLSEPFDVTEEEYKKISKHFRVRVVMSKEEVLVACDKQQARLDKLEKEKRAAEEKRAALAAQKKAASAEKTREKKLAQLKKLQKELGVGEKQDDAV